MYNRKLLYDTREVRAYNDNPLSKTSGPEHTGCPVVTLQRVGVRLGPTVVVPVVVVTGMVRTPVVREEEPTVRTTLRVSVGGRRLVTPGAIQPFVGGTGPSLEIGS